MRTLLLTFMFPLLLAACRKEYPEPANKKMLGTTNAFVLRTAYVSHQGNELLVDLDVGAVGGGMAGDIRNLQDSSFRPMSFPGNTVEVVSVERLRLDEGLSYSNLLLVDVSEGSWGNWNDFDIFNLRTRAFNRMLREGHADSRNKMALASFADHDDGSSRYKLWYWKGAADAYDQTYEEQGQLLPYMYQEEGGVSAIYDALDYLIDYCVKHTPEGNRNITVVNHSPPLNKHGVNLNALAQKAIAAGVRINMISLGDDYNRAMLTLVLKTGGFLDMVSSTGRYTLKKDGLMDKGTPMISAIHRVLQRNLHVYRVRCKLTRLSGPWTSGTEAYNLFEVNELFSDGSPWLSNILPLYAQIP